MRRGRILGPLLLVREGCYRRKVTTIVHRREMGDQVVAKLTGGSQVRFFFRCPAGSL